MAYSRSDYLKTLNIMRNNYQNNGNGMVNTLDDTTQVGEELSSFANLNMPTPQQSKQFENSFKNERSNWQRGVDTFEELGSNITKGTLGWLDGISDFLVGTIASVGEAFGADTQWAEDVMTYDWVSQALNFQSKTSLTNILSGDIFDKDYWNSFGTIGSVEQSRAEIDKLHQSSFISELGAGGQGLYQAITEGIGYILPNIALGGLGAPSLLTLGLTTASAQGSGTSEALQNGATWNQAQASGWINAGIEAGTEALSFGMGKIVGKIRGQATKLGTNIAGNYFKEIGKLSIKELGQAALEEGFEELASELLSPFTKLPYKGKEAFEEYNDPQLYKNAAVSFTSGAVGGAFGGGVQNTRINSMYGKQGAKNINTFNEIAQMQKQAQDEFKSKGTEADQGLISDLQNQIGEKIKTFTTDMESLRTSNPKQFDNVMKFFKNPNSAIKAIEKANGEKLSKEAKQEFKKSYLSNYEDIKKQLGQDVYNSIANEMSNNLTNKTGISTNIRFAKEGEFETSGNKDIAGSRSFIKTTKNGENLILVNPKYKAEFYQVVTHEALSHGVLDANLENRTRLVEFIEKDSALSKEFHKYDSELKELYDNRKTTLESERLARFLESLVSNEKDLNRLLKSKPNTAFKSRLINFLNRATKMLNRSRDSEIVKKVSDTIENITRGEIKAEEKVSFSKTNSNPVHAIVAPYYNTKVTDENYETTKKAVQEKFHNTAKEIADALGIKLKSTSDIMGGFTFTEGENAGKSVNEVAFDYDFGNEDFDKVVLFSSLMGDLGHEQQEATIVSQIVPLDSPEANAVEYRFHVKDIKNVSSILQEIGFKGYSIDRTNKIIKLTNFDLDDNQDTAREMLVTLAERLGDNYVGDEEHGIKSAYLDKETRRTIYSTWSEKTENRSPNTERGSILYKNVIQALERLSKDGGIKFSKTFSSVEASKHYAQHMQSKVLNLKTARDIYDLMLEEISNNFGAEVTIKGIDKASRDLTVDFNTLLNKPTQLTKSLTDVIDKVLDSQIEYTIIGDENTQLVARVDTTLGEHLSDLGLNVSELREASVNTFYEALTKGSQDSKVQKLTNYFKGKIGNLITQIKYYRSSAYNTIKAHKTIQTIKNKLETNRENQFKTGDLHFAELQFFKDITNIKASIITKNKKGISPKYVTALVNNLRGYEQSLTEKLAWLNYNESIRQNADLLANRMVKGEFPNRSLTLEESRAVLDILSSISKDMSDLIKAETIRKHEKMVVNDQNVKVVSKLGLKGSRVTKFIQRELDYASSIDAITSRYFGSNSGVYQVLHGDIAKAYSAQLAKQWEFLGIYEKLRKQHDISEKSLTKEYTFKGKKVTMGVLLDLYCQSRTSIGLTTLYDGGYKYEYKGGIYHIKLTGDDVNTLEIMIPNNFQEFAQGILSLYNNELKQYKSDSDVKIKGFADVLKDDIYYPTNKAEVYSNADENRQQFSILALDKISLNEERKNVTNKPLAGMNIDGRLKAYTNVITKYGEMHLATQDLRMFMRQYTTDENGRSMPREEMIYEAVPEMKKYMEYYITQAYGLPLIKSYTDKKGSMMSKLVSYTLFGNVSVVLKQTASIPTILHEVSFKSWTKAFLGSGGKLAKYGKTKAHLKMQSGLLAERWNNFDAVKAQTLNNNLNKIAKVFGLPMAAMDEAVIVGFAYSAAQYEAELLGFGKIGTQDNDTKAIEILERIVLNTQSNATPIKMSMNRAGVTTFPRKALSYFSSDLQNVVSKANSTIGEHRMAKRKLKVIDSELSKVEEQITSEQAKLDDFLKENNIDPTASRETIVDGKVIAHMSVHESNLAELNRAKEALKEIQSQTLISADNDKFVKEITKWLLSALMRATMIVGIGKFVDWIYGRTRNSGLTDDFAISVGLEMVVGNIPYANQFFNSIQYEQPIGAFDFTMINKVIEFASDVSSKGIDGVKLMTLFELLGMATGIPTKNLYNLVMGLGKKVSRGAFEFDAFFKGYSDTYIHTQYRDAVDSGNINQAKGNLSLLLSGYKVNGVSQEVQNEMIKLYSSGYNAIPKNYMTEYTNDKGVVVSLTDAQINAFKTDYNLSNKDIQQLMSITEYRTSNQEVRAKLMKKVYDTYHSYAKAKVLKAKGDSKVVNLLLATNGRIGLSKLLVGVNALSSIVDSAKKTRKELVLEQLNSMRGYSKAEKILMMYLMGYSVKDNSKVVMDNYLKQLGATSKQIEEFIS